MQDQDEAALKTAFAAALLKTPTEPFTAALIVFGVDTGRALRAAHEWYKDPFVTAECERLKSEGFTKHNKEELRDELIDEMMKIVRNEKAFVDDRVKAGKLAAEIRGLIEKPQTNINNNVVTANKVMVVKDHGNNDDWEKRLLEQQRGLKHGATKH